MIFDNARAKAASRRQKAKAQDATEALLEQFAAMRPGVQAWVEEAAGFNRTSLLLVAADGEWLRRVVPSVDWARDFAQHNKLMCFTAGIDPYPQRMRDWDAAHRHPKEQL